MASDAPGGVVADKNFAVRHDFTFILGFQPLRCHPLTGCTAFSIFVGFWPYFIFGTMAKTLIVTFLLCIAVTTVGK